MQNSKVSQTVLGILTLLMYLALKAAIIFTVLILTLSFLISITSIIVITAVISSLVLTVVLDFDFEEKITSQIRQIFDLKVN